MEKSNFDKLLERYLTGSVSEEERIRLEAWLETQKTDSNKPLSKSDSEKIFRNITARINQEGNKENFTLPAKPKPILAIAASIVFLLACSIAIWKFYDNASPSIGEKIILNDGSLIWLENKSEISYYESADNIRHASLQGEGLFEIAKDPQRPFLIACGSITVKVLGTSFYLRTFSDSLELSVLTGSVSVSSSVDSTGVILSANQKLLYAASGYNNITQLATTESNTLVAGTEYNMKFTNTTLKEVISKVENKFNVQITLAEPAAAKCRITADFTDHSLQNTLELISEILEIKYTLNGNKVALSGPGCNGNN